MLISFQFDVFFEKTFKILTSCIHPKLVGTHCILALKSQFHEFISLFSSLKILLKWNWNGNKDKESFICIEFTPIFFRFFPFQHLFHTIFHPIFHKNYVKIIYNLIYAPIPHVCFFRRYLIAHASLSDKSNFVNIWNDLLGFI